MRRDRIELALHEMTADRRTRRSYLADPGDTLSSFGLDAQATTMITTLDVRGLRTAGVSPLLTWALWLLYSGEGPEAYVAALAPSGGRR